MVDEPVQAEAQEPTAEELPTETPPAEGTATGKPPTDTPAVEETAAGMPTAEPVHIAAYCSMTGDSPVTIYDNQPVTLYWRWDAKTREDVLAHLDASIYNIMLEGQPVYPDRRTPVEYLAEKEYFSVAWFADLGTLTVGTHHSERRVSWTYQISDGWKTYGPGGEIEVLWHDCEIVVQSSGAGAEPTRLPECVLDPEQEVFIPEDTNAWTLPNVNEGDIAEKLPAGTSVYIVSGPRWGFIRLDTDDKGWWYQVRRAETGLPDGWVWDHHIQECQ